MTGVASGVEITMLADIPSTGSGLGSSSSVTVGLLLALFAYQGRSLCRRGAGRARLHDRDRSSAASRSASRISTSPPSEEYATSASGPGEAVVAEELRLTPAGRRALQQQVMLFYTGVTRSANTILSEQNANVRRDPPASTRAAGSGWHGCRTPPVRRRATRSGAALRDGWEAKRKLASGVSNATIDQAVERALRGGRLGSQGHRRRRRRLPAGHLPRRAAACRTGKPGRDAGTADQDSTRSARGSCSTCRATSGA